MTSLIKELSLLGISAAVIVSAVRFLLIPGINHICTHLRWSPKVKGQLIGYSTSLPELIVIITSAWAGVFTAGFWNIASSNIINAILFFSAIVFFRQTHELKTARFIDEIIFAALSITLPLIMYGLDLTLSCGTALLLIAIFAIYKILDFLLNRTPPAETAPNINVPASLHRGTFYLIIGIILILIAGNFLGTAAEQLINALHIPGWLIGWLLGLITSIPEMTSFFEVYRIEKKLGRAAETTDTQQALDALVASNLGNLGIILPAGIILYLLVVA